MVRWRRCMLLPAKHWGRVEDRAHKLPHETSIEHVEWSLRSESSLLGCTGRGALSVAKCG